METLSSRISQALAYDPETGLFTYIGRFTGRRSLRPKKYIGTTAGSLTVRGYVGIGFDGRLYTAHRLAFLFMTGDMPDYVDHKDGDKTNNQWANLRACTKSQNGANRGPSAVSTTGVKGVYLHNKTGRWRAQIHFQGRTIHVGYFAEREQAKEAYDAAALSLFKEFAKA